MLLKELIIFDLLSTPVWVVHPFNENVIFANQASKALSGNLTLEQMRKGTFSTCPELVLQHYLRYFKNIAEVYEIWTVETPEGLASVSCKTTLITLEEQGSLILFEAVRLLPQNRSITTVSRSYQRRNNGFFARFFMTNSAPMLLIDPNKEGRIVDANIAALRFYNYSAKEIRTKHTWQINTLGRDVLPIMHNVVSLPGGHKPLNFTHILSDGSIRHVQTYAGPVTLYKASLMLCIIHDITEEVHLKKELEFSASHDSLTGLLNRREFYRIVESPSFKPEGYCLLLVDIDHFKLINDDYGHQKGDEVLLAISALLTFAGGMDDKIYRWGGEEFLLFLPNASLETAREMAEKIRYAVSEYQTPDLLAPVTVSIGVAEHQHGEEIDQLFNRVDKALYAAKKAGRNKVQLHLIEKY
ncbi:sensor domain-containing diguanylate cyclase [Klebsiella spallanzanii]|uniref:diguanylate cyclase n=1 Tax=Klebsiella spallanzanii TaxID=2587528 RepID=A0A564HK59_9ENTR|nr:sensor domain-containing diguanylate cyclase [Klebsiella spallanzanii]MDM4206466.1 sensor domain-containing diguanylate cyclase [Klebsiella spallanzanii]VUS32994.1 putative diguanylate cyclase YdaM [Klebsiella spallanzanii]